MIQYKGELQKSTKLLRIYSNHRIKPVATGDLTVKFNDEQITALFQIVDLDQENVHLDNTAEALLLISRLSPVDTADLTKDDQVTEGLREFPKLIHTTRYYLEPTQLNWNQMPREWFVKPVACP